MGQTVRKIGPVLSPVDYDAWDRGYMPPTEHILIDALQFREAKVKFMTGFSPHHNMFVVVQGPDMTAKQRQQMRRVFKMMMDLESDDVEASGAQEAPSGKGDPEARREGEAQPSADRGANGTDHVEADAREPGEPLSAPAKPAAA